MTREMNKPDWHYKYIVDHKIAAGTIFEKKPLVLDDWIKPFFDNCCRMEKVNVGKR